ncbi:MAG: hypothetical protein NT076_00050, partial [Candidatus Pacearchaeota archaeon]|nr:hypothetical protein [Candidatus Pacearchaeota archaeon]
ASVGVINTEFNVFYDVPTCDSIDGMWYMPDGNIIDSSDNCYLEEANGGCCPEDFTCEQETGICVPRKIYSCSNYTTETACIGYDSEVANYDINTKENWFNGNFCGGDVFEYDGNGCEKTADNCRCDWNVSEGKCYSQYDLQRSCNGEEPITLGECTFQSTQETDCSLGYRHIEWEALWDPGTLEEVENLECNSGSEDVPCLSETLLGFFDNIGLIIAVLLLILAYWIIVHNKKHHSVRKKKR